MPRRLLLALLALCLTAHALAHGGLGHWVGGAQGPSHAWLHHEGVAHEHAHGHGHGHGQGDAAQPQLKATPEALAHVLADALGCSPALLCVTQSSAALALYQSTSSRSCRRRQTPGCVQASSTEGRWQSGAKLRQLLQLRLLNALFHLY